jgi:hypothetical protein
MTICEREARSQRARGARAAYAFVGLRTSHLQERAKAAAKTAGARGQNGGRQTMVGRRVADALFESLSTDWRSCARTRSEHRVSNVKEKGFERHATYENVLPNRRGVEMSTSELHLSQLF